MFRKKAYDNLAEDGDGQLVYLAPTRVNLNLTEKPFGASPRGERETAARDTSVGQPVQAADTDTRAMFGGIGMSTLTIRLPDDTAERLKSLARSRGLSMNKLVEELSAQALAAWDTENHYRTLAASGDVEQALAILDRLDAEDRKSAR